MKKIILRALLIAGLVLSLNACVIDLDDDGIFGCLRGDGPYIEEVLRIDYFDALDLEIDAEVYITQGPDFLVRVRGRANLVDELDTRVRNGLWEIDFDRCVRNIDDFEIYITMPEITELRLSSSGRIYGENTFVTNDLYLQITGSGDIDLAVDADDIGSRISGSGRLFLEGFADELDHQTPGSGDLRAFGLDLNEAYMDVSGSGDSEITVRDFLRVRISGSGDVYFRGNPTLDVNISGSGDLIDAN